MSGRSPVFSAISSRARSMVDRLRRPRKSHLQQTQVSDGVHLVLGDDLRPLPLLLNGDDLHQRLRGDHHGRGVDGVLAAEALEARRGVDDPPASGSVACSSRKPAAFA